MYIDHVAKLLRYKNRNLISMLFFLGGGWSGTHMSMEWGYVLWLLLQGHAEWIQPSDIKHARAPFLLQSLTPSIAIQ